MSVQRQQLFDLVDSIRFPEAVSADAAGDPLDSVSAANLQSGILGKFLEWLSQQSGIVPSKEDALAWLSAAIDAAFSAMNKPILANILKPAVKAVILKLAGDLYDQLFGGVIAA